MIGIATRIGTTEGLKALGVDRDTAKVIGAVAGAVATVITFDAISATVDATLTVTDGVSTAADLHATFNR